MAITYDPKPLTAEQLHQVSQDVKRVLTDLYGDRLDRVVLFGSYARGDFHEESDVDYLAVLNDNDFRQLAKADKYWDHAWATWLEYGVWLSIRTAYVEKYRHSDLFFYCNVRREGVIL